jgi:hypothetical protein
MGGIPVDHRRSFYITSRETDRGGTVSDRAGPSHRHSISLLPAPPPAGSLARRLRAAALFYPEEPCASVFGCISFSCSQQHMQARRWRTLIRIGLEVRAVTFPHSRTSGQANDLLALSFGLFSDIRLPAGLPNQFVEGRLLRKIIIRLARALVCLCAHRVELDAARPIWLRYMCSRCIDALSSADADSSPPSDTIC